MCPVFTHCGQLCVITLSSLSKKVTKLFFNFFYIAHNRGAASS